MKFSDDIRAKRTKTIIQETFREMLLEMDYDQISIKSLTERAGINRRTFYLHYSVLDDLLRELMDDIADDYICKTNKLNGRSDMREIVQTFLRFFAQQDPLHEKIICSTSFRYISDTINRRISDSNHGHIDNLGKTDPYTKELIIAYLNSSALGMYRKWVAGKKRLPLEDFINLATELICSGAESMPEYLKKRSLPPI